jgi:hypothetical protein
MTGRQARNARNPAVKARSSRTSRPPTTRPVGHPHTTHHRVLVHVWSRAATDRVHQQHLPRIRDGVPPKEPGGRRVGVRRRVRDGAVGARCHRTVRRRAQVLVEHVHDLSDRPPDRTCPGVLRSRSSTESGSGEPSKASSTSRSMASRASWRSSRSGRVRSLSPLDTIRATARSGIPGKTRRQNPKKSR